MRIRARLQGPPPVVKEPPRLAVERLDVCSVLDEGIRNLQVPWCCPQRLCIRKLTLVKVPHPHACALSGRPDCFEIISAVGAATCDVRDRY